VWLQEVERYTSERVKQVAIAARELIDVQGGLAPDQLRRCEPAGEDGTELAGCVKAYLPLDESAPSSRPYAFVLRWAIDEKKGRPQLVFVAFGERHPRSGTKTAYARAHERLHGVPPTPRNRRRREAR